MSSSPPAQHRQSHGAPVAPRRGGDEAPAGSLPQTTAERAMLCDGVLPFLTGLRETLWAITAKDPGAPPADEAIYMGRMLLADLRRLLRGEPMARYLRGLTITEDGSSRFGLALKIATMETAAGLFRQRYFGWHPGLGKPGWHLGGDNALEAARQLLPRAAATPGEPGPASRESTLLRDRLAARIAELKRADNYRAPTQVQQVVSDDRTKEVEPGRPQS